MPEIKRELTSKRDQAGSAVRRIVYDLLSTKTHTATVLGILLFLKFCLAVALYSSGFQGISADEISRSIAAAEWSANPHFVIGPTNWPPFHLYLNGLLLTLIPDPLWVPRITAFLASCLLVVTYYWLITQLVGRVEAALSALCVVVFHWFIGISATSALDVYYLAMFATGLAFFTKWTSMSRPVYVYLAALSFLIGTGFHYQSWLILAILELLSLLYAVKLYRRKQWSQLGHLTLAYLIANAYIFFTLITNLLVTGDAAPYLDSHKDYSSWYYGGYNEVAVLRKLIYYPSLLLSQANPVVLITAAVGCAIYLLRGHPSKAMLTPLLVGGCLIFAFSLFNITSVPATAAPGRFALPFYLCIVPYAGWLLARMIEPTAAANSTHKPIFAASLIIIAAIIAFGAWQTRYELPTERHFGPALAAGKLVNEELEALGQPANYLVELRYWDFLAIKLTAGHYQHMRLDRKFDIRRRDLPSQLVGNKEELADFLRALNIRVAALRRPELVEAVSPLGKTKRLSGGWVIVTFAPWDVTLTDY